MSNQIDIQKNIEKAKRLLQDVNPASMPEHIGIIMDGNGRWAEEKNKPRIFGYKAGANTAKEIVEIGNAINISYLTLFTFSTENWQRPIKEVTYLMELLEDFLINEVPSIKDKNVQFHTIGDLERLPIAIKTNLVKMKEKTVQCSGMKLCLAINYGSRQEILNAVQNIAKDCMANKLQPKNIDESKFNEYLYTQKLKEPDLIIRTSGEQRISNFLLWQSAYAEYYFSNLYWPDFHTKSFCEAIVNFSVRKRRKGKIS